MECWPLVLSHSFVALVSMRFGNLEIDYSGHHGSITLEKNKIKVQLLIVEMKVIYRFVIVITALIVGLLLVSSGTFLGDESSGPIEDLLNGIKRNYLKIEEEIISSKRVISDPLNSNGLNLIEKIRPILIQIDKLLLGAYDNKAESSLQPIVSP
jgi:hypothetical protein